MYIFLKVLSKSVADGIFFYREEYTMTKEQFKDTKITKEMIRLFNSSFDVLNGRHYGESITKENWDGKKEVEFCYILNSIHPELFIHIYIFLKITCIIEIEGISPGIR